MELQLISWNAVLELICNSECELGGERRSSNGVV